MISESETSCSQVLVFPVLTDNWIAIYLQCIVTQLDTGKLWTGQTQFVGLQVGDPVLVQVDPDYLGDLVEMERDVILQLVVPCM